jgi:hypothetical protein
MYIGLHLSASCCHQILMKLEFSRQIFEKKSSHIKFYESHEVVVELFHVDGWTDRHDEANIRLSQF